jgi:hypothetical protein
MVSGPFALVSNVSMQSRNPGKRFLLNKSIAWKIGTGIAQ